MWEIGGTFGMNESKKVYLMAKDCMIKTKNMNCLKEYESLRKSIKMLNKESEDCNMVGVSNIIPVLKKDKIIGIITSSFISELILSDAAKRKDGIAKTSIKQLLLKKVSDIMKVPDTKVIQFVKEADPLDKVEQLFRKNPFIYAVYVTETGDENGEVKGMIRNHMHQLPYLRST